MKRLSFLTIYLLLFTSTIMAQKTEREGETRIDTNVVLLKKNDFDKTIILLKTDKYIVKTSYAILKTNMDNWLKKFPYLKSDERIIDLINEASNSSEVDAEKIAQENNLIDRLRFRIADILQEGNCLIINTENGATMKSVKFQKYSYSFGSKGAEGGRRFYIENTLLFEILDFIK